MERKIGKINKIEDNFEKIMCRKRDMVKYMWWKNEWRKKFKGKIRVDNNFIKINGRKNIERLNL